MCLQNLGKVVCNKIATSLWACVYSSPETLIKHPQFDTECTMCMHGR